jgi:AraC-like DNA-binding protein
MELFIHQPLDGLQLLHLRGLRRPFPGRLSQELGTHPWYSVTLTEKGVPGYYLRGEMQWVSHHQLSVIEPHELHVTYTHSTTPTHLRVLTLTPELWLTMLERPVVQFNPLHIDDTELSNAVHRLHLTFPALRLEFESRLVALLCCLTRRHIQPARQLPNYSEWQAVRQIKAFIRERYHCNISLGELSQLSDLPRERLIRSFRKVVGLPPHSYLLQVRITEAKHLLTYGLSLSETATDVGFVDQSHLHRYFKRLTGVTPGTYRRLFTARRSHSLSA